MPERNFRKSSVSSRETWKCEHRFEHWYADNAVYFITARCRNRQPAFASEPAKKIFWAKFSQYTSEFGFVPWVTSLMDNHYHTLGYLAVGENLGVMMQRLHGSIAKLVNDVNAARLQPFWYDSGKQGYFDGCIRAARQADLAYRYIQRQSMRHKLAADWRDYPHTIVNIEAKRAIHRAEEKQAFLGRLRYRRYQSGRKRV